MTDLARVRIALTGWPGAPGVITEHYSQGTLSGWDASAIQGLVDEVATRYAANSATFIDAMTLTVEASVGIFDAATGDLVDVITAATPPSPINATGSGQNLSRATQVGVRLLTSDFRNGRRVQGRLFWGPCQTGVLTSAGDVDGAVGAGIASAFTASISGTGPRLAVWSRPNTLIARPGDWADVTAVVVSSKPFVLRSRRD